MSLLPGDRERFVRVFGVDPDHISEYAANWGWAADVERVLLGLKGDRIFVLGEAQTGHHAVPVSALEELAVCGIRKYECVPKEDLLKLQEHFGTLDDWDDCDCDQCQHPIRIARDIAQELERRA